MQAKAARERAPPLTGAAAFPVVLETRPPGGASEPAEYAAGRHRPHRTRSGIRGRMRDGLAGDIELPPSPQ